MSMAWRGLIAFVAAATLALACGPAQAAAPCPMASATASGDECPDRPGQMDQAMACCVAACSAIPGKALPLPAAVPLATEPWSSPVEAFAGLLVAPAIPPPRPSRAPPFQTFHDNTEQTT